MTPNLHPVAHRAISRAAKEARHGHRGGVYWLTGLSGAGKSTVALAAEQQLFAAGHSVRLLDGDDVRTGLCADLGFSLTDRRENVRRVAAVARLFCESGFTTICSFVSPTRDIRALAKSIVGIDDFYEVYVDADLATCEGRDVKGLYAKARAGQIKGFTGIDSPFEAPEQPDVTLRTDTQTVAESTQQLIDFILAQSNLEAAGKRTTS